MRSRAPGARSGNNDKTGPTSRTVKAMRYPDDYPNKDCDRPGSAHSSILDT